MLATPAIAVDPPPTARTSLTAERIRVADHGAYVRAVVDFSGGRLRARDATVWDGNALDGGAIVDVRHRRVTTEAAAVREDGIRVRLTQGQDRVRIRLATRPGRFKYVARRQLHDRERVVADLYRATPPAPGANLLAGHHGCLTLTRWSARPGAIQVAGTATALFENQFTLAVRNQSGAVVGRRTVTVAADGTWARTIRYRTMRPQPGTLEAVDLAERDAALLCLAQARVALEP